MNNKTLKPYMAQIKLIPYVIVITLALMLLSKACSAQELTCTNEAQLQIVVNLEGKMAADIYKQANRWVAKNFHAKDKLIQAQIENEMIRGDGYEVKLLKIGAMVATDFSYSFVVDVKDGKMRLTINNMKSIGAQTYKVETYCCKADGSIRSNSQSQNIKESIESFVKLLLIEFNKSGDDW